MRFLVAIGCATLGYCLGRVGRWLFYKFRRKPPVKNPFFVQEKVVSRRGAAIEVIEVELTPLGKFVIEEGRQ